MRYSADIASWQYAMKSIPGSGVSHMRSIPPWIAPNFQSVQDPETFPQIVWCTEITGIELQDRWWGEMLEYRNFYGCELSPGEMTLKNCPFCGAEIHEAAFVCSYCGSDLMVTVPFRAAVRPKIQEQAGKISGVISRLIPVFFIMLSIACTVAFFILLLDSF